MAETQSLFGPSRADILASRSAEREERAVSLPVEERGYEHARGTFEHLLGAFGLDVDPRLRRAKAIESAQREVLESGGEGVSTPEGFYTAVQTAFAKRGLTAESLKAGEKLSALQKERAEREAAEAKERRAERKLTFSEAAAKREEALHPSAMAKADADAKSAEVAAKYKEADIASSIEGRYHSMHVAEANLGVARANAQTSRDNMLIRSAEHALSKERLAMEKGPGGGDAKTRTARTEKFGEAITKSGMPRIETALSDLETVVSRYATVDNTGAVNIPGIQWGKNVITRLTSGLFQNDVEREVWSSLQRVANPALHEFAGSAQTRVELENFMSALGRGDFATSKDLLRGIERLRVSHERDKSTFRGTYGPDAVAQFEVNGGDISLTRPAESLYERLQRRGIDVEKGTRPQESLVGIPLSTPHPATAGSTAPAGVQVRTQGVQRAAPAGPQPGDEIVEYKKSPQTGKWERVQ